MKQYHNNGFLIFFENFVKSGFFGREKQGFLTKKFLTNKEIFIKTKFVSQKIMENRQTQFKTSKIVVKVSKDKI